MINNALIFNDDDTLGFHLASMLKKATLGLHTYTLPPLAPPPSTRTQTPQYLAHSPLPFVRIPYHSTSTDSFRLLLFSLFFPPFCFSQNPQEFDDSREALRAVGMPSESE